MPRSTPKEIARDFAYMSLARGVSLAISFARSLVIPGLLGPTSYGVWKTLALIQTYAQFGDFGARAALRREIPFYAGKQDAARLAEVRDVSFTANNASIFLAALVTVGAALVVEDTALRVAMLVFLPLLYVSHMNSFMEQVLYGHKEFAFMSKLNIWAGVLEAALAVGMTWAYGVTGLILGSALAFAVSTAFQLGRVGYDIRLRWRWGAFKELVSVGFPSHLNGLLYNIFLSIDRWLILSLLGLTSLGYYALGMTINEYLFRFSYTFGNVLSPSLVERYSERERVEDLRGMVEVPMLIIARVAPAALGVVYFVSEGVIRTVLTSFEPGLLPLQILLVGTFFSSVPRGLSSFFITIRRQVQTIHLYVISIFVNLALVWWLLSSGHGLPGAATGTTISLAFFGLGLIVLAMRYFTGVLGIAAFLARLLWPLPLGLALLLACRAAAARWIGAEGTLPHLGLAMGLYLAAYSPVLIALYLRYGHYLRSRSVAKGGPKT